MPSIRQAWRSAPLQIQLLTSHIVTLGLGVLIALSLTAIYPSLAEGGLEVVLAGIVMVVFLSLSSGEIIVRPLKALWQAMAGDLEARAPLSDVPELRRLAVDFNRLAMNLQTVEQRRRQRLAVLMHEINTPLTVLKGDLELARQGNRPLTPDLLGKQLRQIERVKRLAEAISDYSNLSSTTSEVLKERLRVTLKMLNSKHLSHVLESSAPRSDRDLLRR